MSAGTKNKVSVSEQSEQEHGGWRERRRGQIMQSFKAKFISLDYLLTVTESFYKLIKDSGSLARISLVIY